MNTSGFCIRVSLQLESSSEESPWVRALGGGVRAIEKYGGATVGMRTLLDALVPAVDVLTRGGYMRKGHLWNP